MYIIIVVNLLCFCVALCAVGALLCLVFSFESRLVSVF